MELNRLCWCGYVIVFPMGLWWVVQGWAAAAAAALECEFFFWGNFGGDRRVWLSFGGWCCVGLSERGKKT